MLFNKSIRMIINQDYILQQMAVLIKEKQCSQKKDQTEKDKLYRIKIFFPKWLRSIIFHPLNPVYSVFLQHKQWKNNHKKEVLPLEQLNLYATDFIQYILGNNVNFDTGLYYPQEDETTITRLIDNRIKSFINGYNSIPLEENEVRQAISWEQNIKNSTKTVKDGYSLTLDSIQYFLPLNSFAENVFMHDYGLKYVPKNIIEYTKGKDFLDIGAFMGDTAIFFSKKYEPNIVYAYEPIDANIQLLNKTIRNNDVNNIHVVNKGIGNKEEKLDIYFDPHELSNSSINGAVTDNLSEKQEIQITTIDEECRNRTVGLIKMDIEGAEYSAIEGGMETIKRDKPVLLISLYHTGKDFFDIPPLLQEIVPEYKFRFMDLRLAHPFFEKVLIAYP